MADRQSAPDITTPDIETLRSWAAELGFQSLGVADTRGFDRSEPLAAWLARQFHGEMTFLARDPEKRSQPDKLVPGTVSALMVSLDYRPASPDWIGREWQQIREPGGAYISNYARGRDYHKLIRNRLQKLAERITDAVGPFGYRAFCDSAPVMEVALAERAGLGWRGKHTLMLNRTHGSMFFLGALFTDLPLVQTGPAFTESPDTGSSGTEAAPGHCGTCTRCIDICPTRAIVAPFELGCAALYFLPDDRAENIDPARAAPLNW